MKKLVLLTCLLTCTFATAYAATDFKCVGDCTRRGYMYQFCMQSCSYGSMPTLNTPQYAPPPQQKLIGDAFPSAQDRIKVDQQIRETQILQEEINAARIRNQQQQFDLQQQQEEARKRQRILDLQLEEAEAKAAERRRKTQPPLLPPKNDN